MANVSTTLPNFELRSVIDVVQDTASPRFLAAYFERRKEQLQNEERLCAEVLHIPVSDEEIEDIQDELNRSINEIFGRRDA